MAPDLMYETLLIEASRLQREALARLGSGNGRLPTPPMQAK